jgi:hypothetical protein
MRNGAEQKPRPRGIMSSGGTTHFRSHAGLMEPVTGEKATTDNVKTTRPRSCTDLVELATSSDKATVSNARTIHPRSHTGLTEPITSSNEATEGSRVTTANISSRGRRVTTASSNEGCRATRGTKIAAFRSSKAPASGDLATNMGDIGSPEVTRTASSNRGRRAMGDSRIRMRKSNGSRHRGTQRKTSR